MGTISYPHTGMGIVAGIIFFRGYGYGIELPGGYIPVAIPIPVPCSLQQHQLTLRLQRRLAGHRLIVAYEGVFSCEKVWVLAL